MPAIVVLAPIASTTTLALALYDEGAGNHGVSGRVLNRDAFAADHRLIHREGMRDGKPEVSADPISGSKDDQVATHQLACVDDPQLAVPAYSGAHREQRAQSLSGTISAIFLSESKDGIEDDHHNNRRRQRGLAGEECQTTRHPQQDCQQVGELLAEVPQR
jgi:hypothetical protein